MRDTVPALEGTLGARIRAPVMATQSGYASVARALQEESLDAAERAELLAAPLLILILLLVFRSLVAAAIPLALRRAHRLRRARRPGAAQLGDDDRRALARRLHDDGARPRGRLLAADRLALPRGARGGARPGTPPRDPGQRRPHHPLRRRHPDRRPRLLRLPAARLAAALAGGDRGGDRDLVADLHPRAATAAGPARPADQRRAARPRPRRPPPVARFRPRAARWTVAGAATAALAGPPSPPSRRGAAGPAGPARARLHHRPARDRRAPESNSARQAAETIDPRSGLAGRRPSSSSPPPKAARSRPSGTSPCWRAGSAGSPPSRGPRGDRPARSPAPAPLRASATLTGQAGERAGGGARIGSAPEEPRPTRARAAPRRGRGRRLRPGSPKAPPAAGCSPRAPNAPPPARADRHRAAPRRRTRRRSDDRDRTARRRAPSASPRASAAPRSAR